jgi:hypothetical protein
VAGLNSASHERAAEGLRWARGGIELARVAMGAAGDEQALALLAGVDDELAGLLARLVEVKP